MPDNTLSFETRVDLSGLNAGVNQAKSVVGQFGTAASSAMAQAQVATQRLTEAQIAFGQAAEQGSAQAKEILAEYAAEAQRAAAAVDGLNTSEVREATTVRASTSARMAASAELRVFEGNMMGSTRAAGAFLSMLPGIGPAMQAAFPVFGAVALVEVLAQLTGKLAKIYEEWVNLRSLQEGVIKSILTDEEEEIRLSDQRLAQLREQRVLTAELAGGKAGRADRGAAAGAGFDIHMDTNDLAIAKGNLAAVNQQIADLIVKSKETKNSPITDEFGRIVSTTTEVTTAARQAAALIPELTEKARVYSDQIETLNQKLAVSAQRETLRNRAAGEKEEGAEEKANAERLRKMEEQLNKEKTLQNITVKYEFDYWEARLGAFKDGSQQYDSIMQKLGSIAQTGSAKAHEEIQKLIEKAKRDAEEDEKGFEEAAKGMIAAQNMVRDATEAAAESRHEANAGRIETAQASSANANATSLVPDPQEQLNALRSFHQQAIEEDERFIQEEIRIYANEPKKVEELTKQLEQIRRKGNLEWLTDTKNIALQVAQAEQTAIKSMENDIANMFEKAISRQETWAQASVKLYQQVADQFILNLVKMGEQELLALALHKGVMSSKILADAKGAAADSYQWASTWGGPIAGAIAAAAAFAGVLAFDSFEQGGIVNGSHGMPVPIMAHAGERVLSAPQTQNFERMVNGGGSSGNSNSVHLNYAPNINAFDRSGFRSTLQAHQSDIVDIVRSAINTGRLNK